MGKYLIDNNAIVNFFSQLFTEKGMNFMADVIDQTPINSVITEIEALSWINPDKNKEQIVKAFIQDATVLPLTPAVVVKCVSIKRSRKIKISDAILAATAIVQNLTLVTERHRLY